MNRWYAGRVVRVQGTVVKVRVGFGCPDHLGRITAFAYLDFRLKRRVPRIGEFVCERTIDYAFPGAGGTVEDDAKWETVSTSKRDG